MDSPEVCLTIDIDWAHDVVVADTLALIAEYGFRATWFVTHATPMLREIAATPGQELGLHPNFNPLLDGTVGNARHTLLRLQELVVDAVSIRSHSLMRSSRLADLFRERGMTHESNYFLPPSAGAVVRPWRDFSGLIQVPIRWEDDVYLIDPAIGEPAEHLGKVTPLVVDMHPIHIFLNTATLNDYEAARSDSKKPAALAARRRPAGIGGSRDRLVALLTATRGAGGRGVLLRDLQPVTEA